MNIPVSKLTLANGLEILLHEDHACPIVAVNLWYHVGSKNELPGHTGFAHLFEHLMFEGSEHHDKGYFEPLQAAGAALNGSTNADRTNYWEVVPSSALELALWMEIGRLGYLFAGADRRKFSNQRDVVLNERGQNYEKPSLRSRAHGVAGGVVSARPSVPLDDDRLGGRPPRSEARATRGNFSVPTITPATSRWRSRATSTRTPPSRWPACISRTSRQVRRSPPCGLPWRRSRPSAGSCSKIASSFRGCPSRG